MLFCFYDSFAPLALNPIMSGSVTKNAPDIDAMTHVAATIVLHSITSNYFLMSDKASSADRAIPAIPPFRFTDSINLVCCFVGLPFFVLTSMAVKTPIVSPTISGVMVTGVMPIRSDPPGPPTPNRMYDPDSEVYAPVLFLNNGTPALDAASCISDWIMCSGLLMLMPYRLIVRG